MEFPESLRRPVLDWRDRHVKEVEMHLRRELESLYGDLDEELENLRFRDLWSRRARENFTNKYLQPILKNWVEEEVEHLWENALGDLFSIISAHAFDPNDSATEFPHEDITDHYREAIMALLATALGIAGIRVVSALSVVPAAGILGLLGVTTISLPIAIAGGFILGILVSTGVNRMLILPRVRKKWSIMVKDSVEKQILGDQTTGKTDSVCSRLQHQIKKIAKSILNKIDQ